MKSLIVFLCATSVVTATPDREVQEQEDYLGSTKDRYAVVRVKSDNMGSHYSVQRTTYLDEYEKSEGTRVKVTLLLDVQYHTDAGHNDPNSPPGVRKEVVEMNEDLVWGEVLNKYNVQLAGRSRSPRWSDRLSWNSGGVYFDEERLVLWGGTLEKEYDLKFAMTDGSSGKSHPGLPKGEIEEVISDRGWLFLRLVNRSLDSGEDYGRRTKIVPIPPEVTRKVFDWASMQEIYLRVGRYESREEANAEAWKIIDDCRQRKIYGVHFEIWEVNLSGNRAEYLVVDTYSENTIKNNKVEALQKKIGRDLVPISNRGFVEKWEVVAPKKTGDVSPELTE